jgi:hypothetical protein
MTLHILNEKIKNVFQNRQKVFGHFRVSVVYSNHLNDKRSQDGGKASKDTMAKKLSDCEANETKKIQQNKCKTKITGNKDEPCSCKCNGQPLSKDEVKLKYNSNKNKCSIEYFGDKNPCTQHNVSAHIGEYKREDEFRKSIKGDKTQRIISKAIESIISKYGKSWEKSSKFKNGGIKYGVYLNAEYEILRPEAINDKGITYGTDGYFGLIIAMSKGKTISTENNPNEKYNKSMVINATIVTIYPLQNNKPRFSNVDDSISFQI